MYPPGGVPAGGDRVYPYAVVSVSVERSTAHTKSGHGLRSVRLTHVAYGLDELAVLDIDEKLRDLFEEQSLTASGWACDPIRLQVGGPVVVDPNGTQVLSVTASYLFTAKEAKA